jgi:3-oxoacyl-[acyl-carrier-protein] synthase-3
MTIPHTVLPLRLVATGMALPPHSVAADQLDDTLGLARGTTLRHSGIELRHLAAPGETQSDLGAAALTDALRRAQLEPGDIDLLIGACGVQEQALPGTACAIAAAAGLTPGTPAFDLNASCLSFVTALHTAAALLAAGGYRRIAVVSADLPSRGVDWLDLHASTIFGDGAGAAIVEAGAPGQGIRGFRMATYPAGRRLCELRGGGTLRNPRNGDEPGDYLFRMDGRGLFRLAAQVLPGFLAALLARAGCSQSQLDLVVPHQASHLAMLHMAGLLDLPGERIMNIYGRHGNQVAASIPCALHLAVCAGRLPPGHTALLLGTAAGMSVGGMVLTL